jgi:hypothetical protein
VTCMVCQEFEYETWKFAANGTVYFAHGVRVEGKTGAQRIIDHLLADHHRHALEIKNMTALLKCQSNKHPWLNVLEKHKAAQLRCLLQMCMDVYNDTKCETISARSWPSRSLTSEFAQTLVSRFAEDWNAAFTPFVPTGEQMHYCHVNAYLEMLHCIAGDIREKLKSELQKATAVRIQVDGSCDRQQLNVKFDTCRIVNDTQQK